jgi:hypothetical protein
MNSRLDAGFIIGTKWIYKETPTEFIENRELRFYNEDQSGKADQSCDIK